jgi:hypothetical protein
VEYGYGGGCRVETVILVDIDGVLATKTYIDCYLCTTES